MGAGCSQLITDITKYNLGRLRPHFIEVCGIDFNAVTCKDEFNEYVYVTNYTCENEKIPEMEHRLKESR